MLLGYQALRPAWNGWQASRLSARLADHVRDGDFAQARSTLEELRTKTRAADEATKAPLWRFATALPLLGRDATAIRATAAIVDQAVQGPLLPAALDSAQALDARELRRPDGSFDTELIASLHPEVVRMARAAQEPAARMGQIETARLSWPLSTRLRKVQVAFQRLSTGLDTATVATALAPEMLGDDGPRTYLLVVQNNAEIRATGGLPGSLVLLRAEDGKLRLGAQRFGGDLEILREPILPLTEGEQQLYGPGLGTDVRDANLTPSFPRTAELLSTRLERDFGTHVDGVISVDPVALSYIMRVTGPVTVDGRKLDSENVVEDLLHQTYQRIDDLEEQDAFFSAAAREVFAALTSGAGDQLGFARELGRAVGERRLLVWSARPAEQQQLARTIVAGALLDSGAQAPAVGFYLNNAVASKMEYFLDFEDASLALRGCTATGAQRLRTQLTLRSTAPDETDQLGRWVVGVDGRVRPGDIKVILRIYGPEDGRIESVEADGRRLRVVGGSQDGHPVAVVVLRLEPGHRVTVSAEVRTAPGQRGSPTFDWTPGIRTVVSGMSVPATCP